MRRNLGLISQYVSKDRTLNIENMYVVFRIQPAHLVSRLIRFKLMSPSKSIISHSYLLTSAPRVSSGSGLKLSFYK